MDRVIIACINVIDMHDSSSVIAAKPLRNIDPEVSAREKLNGNEVVDRFPTIKRSARSMFLLIIK